MKKLIIIFIGVGMTLVSCKTHLDSLASNASDDVYFNPTKDRKLNVAPQAPQYDQQQAYNPNAGKKGATTADNSNPYYKDPNFNYDDYYDNAYAARVKRFQQPIYGTSYYDSYYTNSYFYNQNPSNYGTSIYSSYNMGSPYGSSMYSPGMGYGSGYGGYYSPSQTFNNAYYNPYYSGYGGYGGYGSSMSMGMGYGSGMGYGCSPYNGMGMGYNPYSMYGYNSYGSGYGSGMGYYNSPMTSSGYYNSYDYNSGTYHYGPRGTHSGGNSTTNSPMPAPHHMEVKNPADLNSLSNGVPPYSPERFSQVSIPKENYTKIVEEKTPHSVNTNQFQPSGITNNGMMYNGQGQSAPVRNNAFNNGNNGNTNYNTNYQNINGTSVQPIGGFPTPRGNNSYNNVTESTAPAEVKPHKWFSGSNWGAGDNSNGNMNNNNVNGASAPSINHNFGGGNFGGGNSGGGGSSGGGVSRPRR